MLYDYFYLCPYTIEDLKIHTCIIYANTSTSTHSDIIYKTEGCSNDDGDNGGTDNNDGANEEEESFELEEEIQHIEKLMRNSNDAMILDEKLPYHQKEKNRHLNDLRDDPHVKEFFDEEVPDIENLNELEDALREAKEAKQKELGEAGTYTNSQSPSKTESSSSSQ